MEAVLLERMKAHVQACLPQEACGLLAGTSNVVREVVPVTNQLQSPVRFRMDPLEQLSAFDWMETRGLELLGIFHSHPAGPDRPSETDIAEAAYQVVHVIWSRTAGLWKAKGYWIEDGRLSDVELYSAAGT